MMALLQLYSTLGERSEETAHTLPKCSYGVSAYSVFHKNMLKVHNTLIIFVLFLFNLNSAMSGMPGGFGDASVAGQEEQGLLLQVRDLRVYMHLF